MATEYKLSYTASEIDEKLGTIDSMVKTVNGAQPDENGNAEVDLTGYATEEYVNANKVILPLPIKEKQAYPTVMQYYVDIANLTENKVLYGLGAIPEEDKRNMAFINYCVYCDDGTRKQIAMADTNDLVSAFNTGNSCILYFDSNNTDYEINITDKSTANNVVFTKHEHARYLGINNTAEYTPTKDYNPATKKYVDDTVASIDIPEVDLTGCATEEFVNSAIAANNIIQPLPIKEKEFTTAVAKYYVDIEQLENNVCYGLTTIPEEEKRNSIRVYYRIYCEDGTFKNVSLTQANYVYSALKAGNNISLMCYMPSSINMEYKVDITDKSTANNVVVTTIYNRDFLGINNTREFTPTSDYQPATKKYVDDLIGGIENGAY